VRRHGTARCAQWQSAAGNKDCSGWSYTQCQACGGSFTRYLRTMQLICAMSRGDFSCR
jgi:hypothetical protein